MEMLQPKPDQRRGGGEMESEPELTIGQAYGLRHSGAYPLAMVLGSMAVLAIMSHLGLLLQDMGQTYKLRAG
ncbi:MAG: hypothetical protein Ct9H300mP11_03620 [Chloroflexota bacterium]|nr:MAG: hypothetical protein Ct9H300mP11_03620 [Chloroflexota bacterium]